MGVDVAEKAAQNMQELAEQLKGIKFRRKLLGGVDEADVWRQLEEIERSYESVLAAQEARLLGRLQEAYDENAWIQEELDRTR